MWNLLDTLGRGRSRGGGGPVAAAVPWPCPSRRRSYVLVASHRGERLNLYLRRDSAGNLYQVYGKEPNSATGHCAGRHSRCRSSLALIIARYFLPEGRFPCCRIISQEYRAINRAKKPSRPKRRPQESRGASPPALLGMGAAPVRKAISPLFEDTATTNGRIKTGLDCCSNVEQVWLIRRR